MLQEDGKRDGIEVVCHLLGRFFALFSCMRVGSEIVPISSVDKSFSDMAPLDAAASVQSTDSTNVARLREILMKGLKLCRQVIVLLAYIAMCSKSGFEILLTTETPKRLNFLESIVRVLASEIDAELANAAEAQSLSKERCSLMREALILLNRLASHPAYSKPTMGALTRGSAAFDVANRLLYLKGRGADGGTKRMQMDAEIVDMTRIFRTRLYGFLGESSTS